MSASELPEEHRDPNVPAILAGEILSLIAANEPGEAIELLISWGIPRSNATAWVKRRFPYEVFYRRDPPAPCPYCSALLMSALAKQCMKCGMDWHDPAKVIRLGSPKV